MPYKSTKELGKGKEGLPEGAKKIFVGAFNSAFKETKSEGRASAIAWSAVKKKYKKNEKGEWVAKDAAEVLDSTIEMEEILNLDSKHLSITQDGYLVANPRVARTGIQLYRGWELGEPDKDIVRVYRPEDQVFHVDAMKTLAHRPVTLDHPPEMVDASNWRKFTVGMIGGEIARDGDFIRVPMTIMDKKAVDAIKDGQAQLSVGYTSGLKWGEGTTPTGEIFDAVQHDIRANHVAVVDFARGGGKLAIGDDAEVGDMSAEQMMAKAKKMMEEASTPEEKKAAEVMMAKAKSMMKKGDSNENLIVNEVSQESAPAQVEEEVKHDPVDVAVDVAIETESKSRTDEDAVEGDGGTKPVENTVDREFSAKKREKAAKTGAAMEGGGFPIENEEDLKNAIRAIGRAKNRAATIAHIKTRARALGLTKLIPENWDGDSTNVSDKRSKTMPDSNSVNLRPMVIDGVSAEVPELSAQLVTRALTDRDEQIKTLKEQLKQSQDAATQTLADQRKLMDEKDGQILTLKRELQEREMTPGKLDKLARERLEVVTKARSIMGDTFHYDGRTDAEIKRACVSIRHGEQIARSLTDEAVNGAFIAMTADNRDNSLARALGDAAVSRTAHNAMDASAMAYEEKKQRLQSGWRQATGAKA